MVLRMIDSNSRLFCTAKREARGADASGRATDHVLGQFDMLSELDLGIEVEGGSHQPIKGERLGRAAGACEIEQADAFGGPGIGHARDPADHPERETSRG